MAERVRVETARPRLVVTRMGIDTYQEHVVYMRADCHVCRSEGFAAQSRVQVANGHHKIIATLNVVTPELLDLDAIGLSEAAWRALAVEPGAHVTVSHPKPVHSLSYVRRKIFGHPLDRDSIFEVVRDVAAGRYSDVQLAAFVTACAQTTLSSDEVLYLTEAMVAAGETIDWGERQIVDKHCVGGLPGNRTTPIIVPIVASQGLLMPKTSSRAITSPAGTADVMETLTRVNLDIESIRRVVEQEGACLAWGGAVKLSPADDVLIRVERSLNLDSEGQLVASVLSKKRAAGATHVVIDVPVGPTAKVRTHEAAELLREMLIGVGRGVGMTVKVVLTNGNGPVGRGIGPALEAHDVLKVLRCAPDAPEDLRERALFLAGYVFDLAGHSEDSTGMGLARRVLEDGTALRKFEAICEAQGGFREPGHAAFTEPVLSDREGIVTAVDNRRLANVAKLAGAPHDATAGVYLDARLGARIERGQPLYTVCSESRGELEYALEFVKTTPAIMSIGEDA